MIPYALLMSLKCFNTKNLIEAGIDEAGRGPGLGRLYTAAVVWPQDLHSPLVKDSKKIKNKTDMKKSYDFVIANALAYAVDYATEEEVEAGVLKANINSMHRAITKLTLCPFFKDKHLEHLLVDGNYFEPYMSPDQEYINYTTVIGGDDTYYSIAAASILAKYSRDQYIEQLCDQYPDLDTRYGIKSNKGYLSAKAHSEGLLKYGYCQFHRKSWKNFKELHYSPVLEPEPKLRIKPTIVKRIKESKIN